MYNGQIESQLRPAGAGNFSILGQGGRSPQRVPASSPTQASRKRAKFRVPPGTPAFSPGRKPWEQSTEFPEPRAQRVGGRQPRRKFTEDAETTIDKYEVSSFTGEEL